VIKSVVIENFCQIGRLEWRPPAGISAVVGPNGAGKSNTVAALAYAISGDAAWAKGAVPPSGKNPKVTVQFCPSEDSDDLVTVSRTVAVDGRGAAASFSYRGKTESGPRAVTAAVAEVLMADPAEAAEAFVCRQGRLTEVADASSSDRLRWVAKSVGLSAAEVAWDALGEIRPPAKPPDLKAARAEFESALSEKQRSFSYNSVFDSPEELDTTCRKLTENALQITAAAEAWDKAKAAADSLPALRSQASSAAAAYAYIEKKLDGVDTLSKWAQDWKARRAWLQYVDLRKRAEKLAEEAKAAAELVPAPPSKPPEWDECTGRRASDESLVRLGQSSSCPTCKSPFNADLAQSIVDAANRLARLAEMTQVLNKFQAEYSSKLAVSQAAARAADTARSKAEAAKAPEVPEPEVSEEAIYAALAGMPTREDVARASSEAGRASSRLAEAEVLAAKLAGPRPDVVSAKSALQEAIDRRSVAAAAAETYAAAAYRADAAAAALARAEAAVETSAKEELFYEAASAARSALHRSACPAEAAAQFADRLAAETSNWLYKFNLRFSVSISADGSITADFDGKQVPSFKLSGAEKTLLGLAWRLAVMGAVAGRFNTLILDEPTYGLDEARLDAVRSAIAEWRDAGTDRQVILVTHDRRLAEIAGSAFDVSAVERS